MHDSVAPLQEETLPWAECLQLTATTEMSVLGALCFAPASLVRNAIGPSLPCLIVPMTRLDGVEPICEIWRGDGIVSTGQRGDIVYRHDDEVLFGVLHLAEIPTTPSDKTPLQQLTDDAYRQIFALLDALNYPYLFRFWNYIADINTHSFGMERYWQFNLGRQDAFLASGREVKGNVPAACALGFNRHSEVAGLNIAFLAGRKAPCNIENPRQISAYQYPPQYGPRSPTFSRASLVQLGGKEVLFISGTASIVGHATLHANDVIAQTRETLSNIEAVVAEANLAARQTHFDLASLHYKVYLRHSSDLEAVRGELERLVGCSLNAIYLQADVCRKDLLLEIEATAGCSPTSVIMQSNAA